jgi:capsid portal protein
MSDIARSDAAVILSKEQVSLSFIPGELPGAESGDDSAESLLNTNVVEPPVSPKRATIAVASNGELSAVCAAVADGTAGMRYTIEPRFERTSVDFDLRDPKTWPKEVRDQHNTLQVFTQAGFLGKGAQSLRMGFKEEEHDRVVLGWGGVVVLRDDVSRIPKGLGRFQACNARFTRPSNTVTMVPIPIALQDGTIIWVEEPRHFRRIRYQMDNNRYVWYKQFGDWRSMDMKTGKYSSSSRRVAPTSPFKKGKYYGGSLPENGVQALEVMHWSTTFPGVDPYGMSGWHSELTSVDSALEATKLLLSFLRSGLHSVIIAAANRPFEQSVADSAVQRIDELGRGRKGLGALITISLVPSSSEQASSNPFADDSSSDRGKLVLHELNTKLPSEVLNGSLKQSLGSSFAQAERIPELLLGKSGSYNFATASAAWSTVNRLRFAPHHEEREAFLDRLLIEMGVVWWRLSVDSPEWEERESLPAVATIAGQNGGLSANRALEMLSMVMDLDVKKIDEWWGDIPMPLVSTVLNSPNPKQTLQLLGYGEVAEGIDFDQPNVAGPIVDTIDAINETAESAVGKSNSDE